MGTRIWMYHRVLPLTAGMHRAAAQPQAIDAYYWLLDQPRAPVWRVNLAWRTGMPRRPAHGGWQALAPGGTASNSVAEFRKLLGHVTIVQRAVAGIVVVDSFAWAMFNANDEVLYEQVWWPELPGALVDDIAAFQARLAERGFRDRLLRHGGEGRLAVHHATPTGEHWYAQVTFDVWGAGDPQIRHFDRDGAEVQLLAWTPEPSDRK